MIHRIEAALLIPGRGDPVERGAVVIEGARITFAGPTRDAPSADHVTEVETVMPGLWECHGHFFGSSRADIEVFVKEPIVARAARAADDVARTLAGGVTSVREVGGMGVYLNRVVAEGRVPGPTIHAAGAILSMTGGHADIHGFPLDWVTNIPESEHFSVLCDGVPDCLKAVRLQLRKGATVIKVCASGGVGSELDDPIHQQFSSEELEAIVAEAARADVSVAAHCHGKPGIMAALRAGVKTIEHGSYLDEEAAELMKRRNAILVPTRFIIERLLDMEEVLPSYFYRKAVAIADQHAQALKLAVAAGVTIAMGTDILVSGDDFGCNSDEIRLLIEAGMTPVQAIEAATANGPLTLGKRAPRSGVLAEGFDADVIALAGDALADTSVWGNPDNVTHVWKAGRLMKGPA